MSEQFALYIHEPSSCVAFELKFSAVGSIQPETSQEEKQKEIKIEKKRNLIRLFFIIKIIY